MFNYRPKSTTEVPATPRSKPKELYPCVNAENNTHTYGNVNTFTAIVDLSRSNFSIARAPFFQLKSAM